MQDLTLCEMDTYVEHLLVEYSDLMQTWGSLTSHHLNTSHLKVCVWSFMITHHCLLLKSTWSSFYTLYIDVCKKGSTLITWITGVLKYNYIFDCTEEPLSGKLAGKLIIDNASAVIRCSFNEWCFEAEQIVWISEMYSEAQSQSWRGSDINVCHTWVHFIRWS